RSWLGSFVDIKGLTWSERPKSSLHLKRFFDAAQAPGQGQAQAVEQHFLCFVWRGVALAWALAVSTTSPLLILAISSSNVRGASPNPPRRIHCASVFHNTY